MSSKESEFVLQRLPPPQVLPLKTLVCLLYEMDDLTSMIMKDLVVPALIYVDRLSADERLTAGGMQESTAKCMQENHLGEFQSNKSIRMSKTVLKPPFRAISRSIGLEKSTDDLIPPAKCR